MSTSSKSRRFTGVLAVDLVAVALLGLWTSVAALGFLAGLPGRSVGGFVAMLFAPGYALVAALFPAETVSTDFGDVSGRTTTVERVVLAVGLSVCVVPLLGLGTEQLTATFDPAGLRAGVGVFTVALAAVAGFRRSQLRPEERADPSLAGAVRLADRVFRPSPSGSNVSTFIAVGLLLGATGIGVATLTTERGEQFTEFAVTTESENGTLVADDYPERVPQGTTTSLYTSITNHEGSTIEYTVVVVLQDVEASEVRTSQQLAQFDVVLTNGETVTRSPSVTPRMAGEDLRLTYLLYRGSGAPTSPPTAENAYRSVHIWVDVPASGTTATALRSPDR